MHRLTCIPGLPYQVRAGAVAPDTLPGKDQSTHKQLGPTCSRG